MNIAKKTKPTGLANVVNFPGHIFVGRPDNNALIAAYIAIALRAHRKHPGSETVENFLSHALYKMGTTEEEVWGAPVR